MDRLIRARILLAEAESLGITIDDLVTAAADRPATSRPVPTAAEHIAAIDATFTQRTGAAYRSYWKLAEQRFGDRPIDSLDEVDAETVVADAIERAHRRRPGCDGVSTRENCIAALRAMFARAHKAGYVSRNPAAELAKPRRRPSNRRALDDDELAEAIKAVQLTSNDPDLDLLLVRFHLESGARRSGALGLRLGDLNDRRCTVILLEKGGIEREQPVSPLLLMQLEIHARSRGAVADEDAVFRTKRGRPMGRRRYDRLFTRAQAVLPWTKRTPVTAHVLRHTTATAVERLAGQAVAQAFLGHTPASVTGIYTKGRIKEVDAAIATLTGEPHPLAA